MSKKESESSAGFLKVQKELASIQTKLDNLLKRKKKKMKVRQNIRNIIETLPHFYAVTQSAC